LATNHKNKQGRLVLNHSTHIEGLIPILKKLSKEEGISTITPGAIARVKGRSNKLVLRLSISIRGGFKLIARRGYSAQETFIITKLEEEDLKRLINKHV